MNISHFFNMSILNCIFSGYHNAEVVYLEEKRMKDQMQLILCTDVLIGVQGAGLQWLVLKDKKK